MFNKSIKTKVSVFAFLLFSAFSFAQGDFLGEDESGFQFLFSAQKETVEDGVDFSASYSFNGKTDVSLFYGSYSYPNGFDGASAKIDEGAFGVKLTHWIHKGIELPLNMGVWAEYQSESYDRNNQNIIKGSQIGIGFVTSYHASIDEGKLYIHPYLSVGIESDTKKYQQINRKDTVTIGSFEFGNNLGFRVGEASSVYIRSAWLNSSQRDTRGVVFGIGFLQGL